MALYAANNIYRAVQNFADRSYARVSGILLNRRNVPQEEEKVRRFAEARSLPILADFPRSDAINHFEEAGKTVIEGDSTLPISQQFLTLAKHLRKR